VEGGGWLWGFMSGVFMGGMGEEGIYGMEKKKHFVTYLKRGGLRGGGEGGDPN